MKKLFFIMAFYLGFATISFAQVKQETKKEAPKKEQADQKTQKDHVCSAACKDGKHVYKHGEKGHVCSKECKKLEKTNKKMHKESKKEEEEKKSKK